MEANKPIGAYNAGIRWLKSHNKEDENYRLINCLVEQYYYGIEAKRELESVLDRLNVEYIKTT